MSDLVNAFEKKDGLYYSIRTEKDYTIIIDRTKADVQGDEILKKYRISDDRSLDLIPTETEPFENTNVQSDTLLTPGMKESGHID